MDIRKVGADVKPPKILILTVRPPEHSTDIGLIVSAQHCWKIQQKAQKWEYYTGTDTIVWHNEDPLDPGLISLLNARHDAIKDLDTTLADLIFENEGKTIG